MTSDNDTDSFDNDNFPDSIAARSGTSLISFRRYHPAWRIWAILLAWGTAGDGDADSISCAKPRIALSGVRSSWLMLERKSDLARLAFSAADLAICSLIFVSWSACSKRFRSSSTCQRAVLSVPISRD